MRVSGSLALTFRVLGHPFPHPQFIEGRLEKLNKGEGFSDLFEQEITCSCASSGTLRSYQLWADNLKKGGGALLHSVKAKTQPAVRNMYRSVRLGWTGFLLG